MKTINYQITLEEPALFTTLAGDPNSLVSFDYIPGSVLRGMVIGALLRSKGRGFTLDAGQPAHRRQFFSGETRFLNAYPVVEGDRALPVPKSWKSYKYLPADEANQDMKTVFDMAVTPNRDNNKKTSPSGFVTFNEEGIAQVIEPKRAINVHTQRNRNTRHNRNSDNRVEQAVFRYDALAKHQTFVGIIQCDNADDVDTLGNLLAGIGTISIGGARSAGYGLVKIHSVEKVYNWQEIPLQDGNPLLLTLLSDVILRDASGVYNPTPDTLQHWLNTHGIPCKLEVEASDTVLVGGFNRKWGLPLPQVSALAMGSVFEMTLPDGELSRDAIQAILAVLQYGIGERTIDGFGRVAIGWQQSAEFEMVAWEQTRTVAKEKVELSDTAKEIWSGTATQSGLIERLRIQMIEKQLKGTAYTSAYTIRGRVTRTQLARLRTIIANELRKADPKTGVLSQYLADIKGKNAERLLDDSRIRGSQRLSDWLKNPDFGSDIPSGIKKRDKYLLRMVDAVLERAHKEKTAVEGV